MHKRCFGDVDMDYAIVAEDWRGGLTGGADVSGWDGEARFNSVNPAFRSAPYGRGHTASRESEEAFTYTDEVVVFGVKLSARSGYSNYVRMDWQFGNAIEGHYLFGYDGPPTRSKNVYSF